MYLQVGTYYFKQCAIIKSFGSYLLDGMSYDMLYIKLDTHTFKAYYSFNITW